MSLSVRLVVVVSKFGLILVSVFMIVAIQMFLKSMHCDPYMNLLWLPLVVVPLFSISSLQYQLL